MPGFTMPVLYFKRLLLRAIEYTVIFLSNTKALSDAILKRTSVFKLQILLWLEGLCSWFR